ncbi:MAG: type II CAAX endopeptidase family protein [Oscillospiraceae bacterium]|nr:type II CAAX endopeptidase family protein [Oscillospiraceae bacterium]
MYNYNFGYPPNYMPPINFGYNPLLAEKQKTKKVGNVIGISLIILIVLSGVLGTISGVVLAIMGQAAGDANLFINDGNLMYGLSSAISVIIMTIPFIICAKYLKMSVGSTVSTDRVSLGITVPLVLIGFGFNAIANYLNNIFAYTLSGLGIAPSMPDIEYGSGFIGFAISMLCIGVFPALVEEFAFRGVVLGILKKRFNSKVAIVVSAIIFGLVHGNLVQIPFAFLMGLVFGFITVYSKSIWPSVIAHFLNNGVSVVLDFTASDATPLIQNVIWCAYGLICGSLAIIGLIMINKRDDNIFKFDTDKSDTVGTVQRVKWLVTAPGMLVFGVLIGIEIIATQLMY